MKNHLFLPTVLLIVAICSGTFGMDKKDTGKPGLVSPASTAMTCTISREDVLTSIEMVHKPFTGDYGRNPIHEGKTPVGAFQFEGPKVYINFRGALGMEFLPILLGKELVAATELGIEGKVHKSLLSASLALKPSILAGINNYCSNRGLNINTLQIYLGGYSRGSAFATLLAPMIRFDTDVKSVQCITYGTLNLFDQVGAEGYNSILGLDNYVGFIAMEDFSRSYLPYSPVGNTIEFSAQIADTYQARVQSGEYTYLDPLGTFGMKAMKIGVDQWQAHMPLTYREAIPKLYQAAIRN